MKRLLWIIVAMAGLVAVVTGCDGMHRYDGRLEAADSLMYDDADSALALVEAIDAGSLTTDGDRAYRDLLLTQARYRCYIAATSDSAINRALAYYRAHDGEREKLTRCYLYKGAVMGELGQVDSAMLYYKTAEVTAAPDDYFNLGYVKLRIAELYQAQLSQDSAAISRLHQAIRCFEIIDDTTRIISACAVLGSIYANINPDSSRLYLVNAIDLANRFDPSLQYTPKSFLAGVYFYQDDFEIAKNLSVDIINNGKELCNQTQFYYYAILSYIKLGKVDSAKQILKITPLPIDDVDSMNYYNVMAEIAALEHNHHDYHDWNENSQRYTEQILSESKQVEVAVSEVEFDKQYAQNDYKKKKKMLLSGVSIALLCLLLTIVAIIYLFNLKLKRRIRKNEEIKKELEDALMKLQDEIEKNRSVSELVSHRMAALYELYHSIRIRVTDDQSKKKILPLTSVLKDMNDRKEILTINLNDSFWDEMILSVDGEYNGIYTFVKTNFPNLTEKELKIFCLQCANLSPQVIMHCMNLTTPRTVTNYKSLIIKKKMGLNLSFDEFVKKYINGELGCDFLSTK